MTNEDLAMWALKRAHEKLDMLVGACMDSQGKPKAPPESAINQARACLPHAYKHSFKRSK